MPVTPQRKTPGVYVTEEDAFPPSIVGVQTAVPGFVGYTAKAEVSGKPVYLKPRKIASLAEFESVFGGQFKPVYSVTEVTDPPATDPDAYDVSVQTLDGDAVKTKYYKLEQEEATKYYLYRSMRFFFDNGGGECYVVSVGHYKDQGPPVALDELRKGLDAMRDQAGPTMLVVPDATLLPAGQGGESDPLSPDYATLVSEMLKQAAELQDRVAILDLYGTAGLQQGTEGFKDAYDKVIESFRTAVAQVDAKTSSYGAAYFPFLNTSTVVPGEVTYENFTNAQLTPVLKEQSAFLYADDAKKQAAVDAEIDKTANPPVAPETVTSINQNLLAQLPVLQQMENIVADKLGLLPPSGAMAGIWTRNDNTRGVWNAPANVGIVDVVKPNVLITDKMQEDLNVPLDGRSIAALREFTGRGTVVWGARTLDGNSQDWRYIQVRRTIVYIETSIKLALQSFVFAPNTGATWVTVVSSISNFLQGLWTQGGLMGDTASEAFTVECGLGSTMTAQDILDGYMNVQVTLQMVRPAEFIELSFKQKMQAS